MTDDLRDKADLALSDLIANGGELTESEAHKFVFALLEGSDEYLRERIDHHLARAAMHTRNKNYEWAVGSHKKALKWSRRLTDYLEAKIKYEPHPIQHLIADRMAQDFEDLLLNGDPGSRSPGGIFGSVGGVKKIGFGTRILRKAADTKGSKQ